MSEEITEKLMKKLRKLMALKDSALEVGSLGEAEAAAAAIQRLLREYNLAEEDIVTEEKVTNPVVMETLPFYRVYLNSWNLYLMHTLCQPNLCELLVHEYSTGGKIKQKTLTVIGRQTNVKVVTFLGSQLGNRFVALCKQAYVDYARERRSLGFTPRTEQVFARSFLEGCVTGLDKKLSEQNRPTETGLVLSRKEEIKNFIQEKVGEYRVKNSNRSLGGELNKAFYDGYQEGKNAEIYDGIENQNETIPLQSR